MNIILANGKFKLEEFGPLTKSKTISAKSSPINNELVPGCYGREHVFTDVSWDSLKSFPLEITTEAKKKQVVQKKKKERKREETSYIFLFTSKNIHSNNLSCESKCSILKIENSFFLSLIHVAHSLVFLS